VKQVKKSISVPKKSSIKTRINKSLDKYADEVLFPKKLARANKLLKGVKIPSA
jgi:hypothetical protein